MPGIHTLRHNVEVRIRAEQHSRLVEGNEEALLFLLTADGVHNDIWKYRVSFLAVLGGCGGNGNCTFWTTDKGFKTTPRSVCCLEA